VWRKFSFRVFTFERCQSGSNLAILSKYTEFFDQFIFQLSRLESGLHSIIRFAIVAFSFETRNNSRRRFSWLRLRHKSQLYFDYFIVFIHTFLLHIHYEYLYYLLFAWYVTFSLIIYDYPVRLLLFVLLPTE
jgi:hypothetical protein